MAGRTGASGETGSDVWLTHEREGERTLQSEDMDSSNN
jgi:hypothetical protein